MSTEKELVDLMRSIVGAIKKEVEVKIPCIVTAVTSRKKVTVRPLIKIVAQDGATYSRDVIEGIPVFMYGAGDNLISFPVKVGDKGWLEASDRDLSLFLQSFTESEPPTKRMHSFSDGLFVPDIMDNFTISESDSDALVIQSSDGVVKIALDNEIRIINNAVDITITGSAVTGIAPGGFNLNGFTIDASGAAISPVSIAAPSVLAGGVELTAHVHGGVARSNKLTDPVV